MAAPHDALVKRILSQPEHATAFLAHVLPSSWLAHLDLSGLALESGSFVDEALRERHADLLFSVPMQSGSAALFHVILEHKSRDEPTLLQVQGYALRIWTRWRAEHPREPLPPILPVVVYHGRTPWSRPCSLREQLALPEALSEAMGAYVPDFRVWLVDLTATPDDGLPKQAVVGLLARMLKHSRRDSAVNVLRGSLEWFRKVWATSGREDAMSFLEYAFKTGPLQDRNALFRLAEEALGEEGRAAMTTIADALHQEGWQEGRQEGLLAGRKEGRQAGRQEGRQVGRKEGRQVGRKEGRQVGRKEGRQVGRKEGERAERERLVHSLLSRRFGRLSLAVEEALRQASFETLGQWFERALDVDAPEE